MIEIEFLKDRGVFKFEALLRKLILFLLSVPCIFMLLNDTCKSVVVCCLIHFHKKKCTIIHCRWGRSVKNAHWGKAITPLQSEDVKVFKRQIFHPEDIDFRRN